MTFALQNVSQNILPAHTLSDVYLAAEQALTFYGKDGRVVIEASLLRTLLDEMKGLEEERPNLAELEANLCDAEDKVVDLKKALKALVAAATAFKEGLPPITIMDKEVKEGLSAAVAEAEEVLKDDEEEKP